MRFQHYLIEKEMTLDQALKVFNISVEDASDKDKLKKQYRVLSLKHHPDKGGDIEKSKDINNAYEVLSKSQIKISKIEKDENEREKYRDKYRSVGVQIKTSLLSNFKPEVFTSYFQELNGNKYFYEIVKSFPVEGELKGKYRYPTRAGFEVEFFTKDRTSIFTFKISTDLLDIVFPKNELGYSDISYTVYTEAYGFHMKKKQKMSQRDWKFTRNHSFFENPEQLFPKKKMNDIFSGKTSKRKFQKRDMISYLTKKLKADWNGEWMRIPLGNDYKLVIYRTTFMRQGAWSINGIYLKHSRISQPRFCTFMEEEQTAEIFEKIQKEIMKVKDEAKVKKTETLIAHAYEAYKKSKGI